MEANNYFKFRKVPKTIWSIRLCHTKYIAKGIDISLIRTSRGRFSK